MKRDASVERVYSSPRGGEVGMGKGLMKKEGVQLSYLICPRISPSG